MSSVGGVSPQQHINDIRQEKTQQAKELVKTGAGHITKTTLSVSHHATDGMEKVKGAVTGAIAQPKKGALEVMNKMDPSTLEATISGLRTQTDEIQAKFQREVITKNKERLKNFRDKKLQQLKDQLDIQDKGKKCQNVMRKVLPVIAAPILLVKTKIFKSGSEGQNKSNAIQNAMMEHKYGSENGEKMARFKEDYKQVASKEAGASGGVTEEDKARLHQQLDELQQSGVLDEATHNELSQMINSDNMSSIDIDTMLVDHMMGEKQPLLSSDSNPEEIQVQDSSQDAIGDEITVDSGSSSVTEGIDSADQDNKAWLAKLATMMQQQEEEAQMLGKLKQDIEDGKASILQSNQDSLLQTSMKYQMI